MTPGERFAERFLLQRRLGAGGMGAVYVARDELTGAHVALKTLTLGGASARARFEREALTLASLTHPNIVGYIAHGLTPKGEPWLAMEWVEGLAPDEAGLGLADALRVVRGAARGLAAAHARGVIHRDVKPSNLILVGGDPEQVKLLDFGIARGGLCAHASATLTATGETIGTPHFMAPEQARGDKRVGPEVDVYSLGAVLYFLLAGRPPLEGQSALAVLAKILLEQPPPIDDLVAQLPADVSGLVHAMLARDPAERLPDAVAVLAALDALAPVPEGTARRKLAAPVAIGEAERRLACLVLVGADPSAEAAMFAPTLASEAGLDPRAPMVDVVRQYGGHAELLADGTMVATFPPGLPTDQARRAATCALALRGVVANKPIAVVAGQSLVSSVVPLGEALERAARLLADRPREVSDEVARVHVDGLVEGLLGPRFECRALGPERFELIDVRVDRAASRKLLGVEVPCVGRRRELAMIAALHDECAEESVARALVVVGAAGSGKTRLVHEACAAARAGVLDGSVTPVLWEGRADAARVGAPYGVMADLLRRAAGLREADSVAVKQMRLAQFLGAYLSGPDLQRALFFLGEMVRAPFPNEASDALRAARTDPTLMSDAIRNAALQLLRAATQRGLLVLLLDDFQHGDQPSRDLLHHAQRQLEGAPLLVIAVGRSELESLTPPLWADCRPQVLRLTKLTPRASAALVDAVLAGVSDAGYGALPPHVVASLIERADGNPFFLEEMLRGALHSPDQALPDTVLGMLQARLGTLDGEARRVLRAASVFGARFWGGAVGRLLGRADAPDATLEHLSELELIDLAAERDVPSEWTWRFRQELTREAAYATLTPEDRRLGHQLASEWLVEQRIADPLTLAGHLMGAEQPARAAEALSIAADEALEAGDHHAASRHVQRALALLAELPRELAGPTPGDVSDGEAPRAELGAAPPERIRTRLYVAGADAQRWLGAYPASLEYARLALAGLHGGDESHFRALGCAVVAAGQTGATDTLDAALVSIQETPARDDGAQLLRLIGLCRGAHQRLGQRRLQDADALLALAGVAAEKLGRASPVVAAWLHTTFAARAHVAGDWLAYNRESEQAVHAYDQARDLRHACNQRVRLGYGLVEVAEFERAVEVLRRAVDDSAELGVPLIEGFALQNLGLAQLRCGQLGLAHATLRNAEARGDEHGHQSVVAGACYYLVDVLLGLARVSEASVCAERAEAGFAGSPFHQALALTARARVALARGEHAEALALMERAVAERVPVAFAESSDAVLDLTLAAARRAAGDEAGAQRALRAGVERLELYLAAVPDPAGRDRMRARIPAHAELLRLASRG